MPIQFDRRYISPEPLEPVVKLSQTWRNYVCHVALDAGIPLVTPMVRRYIVRVHTEYYVEASERDAEARRSLFDAFFDVSVDVYLRALKEGYPESQAREITHVTASWIFGNHGWGELVEYPPSERDAYHTRYSGFFERHGMAPDAPLGEFSPEDGLPDAPETPDRTGDLPMASPGLTDGVYVDADEDELRLPNEGDG